MQKSSSWHQLKNDSVGYQATSQACE